MADSPILPGQYRWKVERDGKLPDDFWRFFRDLIAFVQETQGNTSDLATLEARLAALEQSGLSADILGNMSVQVFGSLEDGQVMLQLRGDAANPGPSTYYGTNFDGDKGFHALPVPPPALPPYFIPSDSTYTVPEFSQALVSMPIDIEGLLVVDGFLIEVD